MAPTKGDLVTQADIHDLVVAFYREIMLDELLEPIFGDIAEVDWVEHIPRLIDYWRWILLGTPRYAGTATKTHRHLHGLHPLESEHCDRWFSLWVHCVDQRWAGRNAERAKDYASMMMTGLAKRVFDFAWAPPSSPSQLSPRQLGATMHVAPLPSQGRSDSVIHPLPSPESSGSMDSDEIFRQRAPGRTLDRRTDRE